MSNFSREKDVVLLGAGHTNGHVLRMWRMQPIPGAHLTCVSDHSVATYSGMLPGVLAGQYPPARMEIDLVRLCSSVGARLIVDRVVGFDAKTQSLQFEHRPAVAFDALSIGIGSVPDMSVAEGAPYENDPLSRPTALSVKPMQSFLDRLESALAQTIRKKNRPAPDNSTGQVPISIVIVGGGAGGIEIAFCLPIFVRSHFPDCPLHVTVIHADQTFGNSFAEETANRIVRELRQRNVATVMGRRVIAMDQQGVILADRQHISADLVLWTTNAVAPPLLHQLQLPQDKNGFLLTDATLRTTAGLPIFAVGDSGSMADHPAPKAGVYAVRQGPILFENLKRVLQRRELKEFEPQADFLRLLNLGNGQAIGEFRGRSFQGKWVWRCKDFIDGRFMDKFQEYLPFMPDDPPLRSASTRMLPSSPASSPTMRCAGCGGKLGGKLLQRVLDRLEVHANNRVDLGIQSPDDVAIVCAGSSGRVAVTTDAFAAPWDDPYLIGRIAALHSASDAFATGARPFAALAAVTVPYGSESWQERVLYQVMAGGVEELNRMGTILVGGHSMEGPQLTVGFTILADPAEGPKKYQKSQARVGDKLVLTKALGTGILLAAHRQARCQAAWVPHLWSSLLASNQSVADLLPEFDVTSVTDITGFGLAGHLWEMLQAAQVSATLRLETIPLLPGVTELLSQGVESTLASANRHLQGSINSSSTTMQRSEYQAIFDPQTSGGLLIAVHPGQVDALVERIRASGGDERADERATVIGSITPAINGRSQLRVTHT